MILQQLKPKVPNQNKLRKIENENQKRYYDNRHRARRLATLKPGEMVCVPTMKKTAKVLQNEEFVQKLLELLMGSHTVETEST